jgi:hypothetical protein
VRTDGVQLAPEAAGLVAARGRVEDHTERHGRMILAGAELVEKKAILAERRRRAPVVRQM